MKYNKLNYGWIFIIIAWIISSALIPFLPELMRGQPILGFHMMEYIGTIGLFGAIFSLVWIPVGIRSAKAYSVEGIKKPLVIVCVAFLALAIIWALIFTFLWNS
ncbi:MAG: hypothetical protein GX958_06140 [Desulfitobacterium sp.]|nr:hypothetical protein [Desulfitobacterium sp.]